MKGRLQKQRSICIYCAQKQVKSTVTDYFWFCGS